MQWTLCTCASPNEEIPLSMFLRVSIPVEEGNAALKAGTFDPGIERILADLKPEAAYFLADDHGNRSGSIVFDMKGPAGNSGSCQTVVFAFNAKVLLRPVMAYRISSPPDRRSGQGAAALTADQDRQNMMATTWHQGASPRLQRKRESAQPRQLRRREGQPLSRPPRPTHKQRRPEGDDTRHVVAEAPPRDRRDIFEGRLRPRPRKCSQS